MNKLSELLLCICMGSLILDAAMVMEVHDVSNSDSKSLWVFLVFMWKIILRYVVYSKVQGCFVPGRAGLRYGFFVTPIGGTSNPKSGKTKYSAGRIIDLFELMVSEYWLAGICNLVMQNLGLGLGQDWSVEQVVIGCMCSVMQRVVFTVKSCWPRNSM